MRSRIGVAVTANGVAAVLLHRGAIVWRGSVPVSPDAPLTQSIAALLRYAPVGKLAKPGVVAAIGPSASQVKVLRGLPAVRDPRLYSRIIRSSPERFFLRNGVPLLIAEVAVQHDRIWGAALDEPVVQAVVDACRVTRLRLLGCVPSLAVIGNAFTDGYIAWHDGPAFVEVTVSKGVCSSARRGQSGASVVEASIAPALEALGDEAADFAEAFAAATAARRQSLLLRPRSESLSRRTRLVLRMFVCMLVLAAGLVVIVAPGLSASREQARAERELAGLQPRALEVAQARQKLRLVSEALDQVEAFDASRRSALEFLGGMNQALPESTALVMLRVDSVGGNFVAITRAGATVLAAVADIDGVMGPQLIGSMTHELSNGIETDRLSIRFRFRRISSVVGRGETIK
jgi:hypothetical protein